VIDPTKIDDLIAEAKTGFDLRGELEATPKREDQITLYTDEPAGVLLGHPGVPKTLFAAAVEPTGILGALDQFGPADPSDDPETVKERGELESRREALITILESTAYTVGLRNIPPLLREAARREAKQELGIKGKVGESDIERFNYANNKYLLVKSATYIYSHAAKSVIRDVKPDDAGALLDLLPESEVARLTAKIRELLNSETVSSAVTNSPDF
jgi:8-oxo-dGTP pyrophosphatase MutT (NUDIX family)